MRVILDPAHGGKFSGSYSSKGFVGVREDEYVLRLARKLKASLEALGHEAIMLRTGDTEFANTIDGDNVARAQAAESHAPYDLVLLLHMNTATIPLSGARVFYDTSRQQAQEFVTFAKEMQSGINDALGLKQTEFKQEGVYHMTCARYSGNCLLVETCYLSNAVDEQAFAGHMDTLADRMATVANSFLDKGKEGVTFIPDSKHAIAKPSPNHYEGRMGYKAEIIVDHITQGDFPGCMTWLCNPVSKASAHYIVTLTGGVYQLVSESDAAWGNGSLNSPTSKLVQEHGDANPNYYTISIEHEGYSGNVMPSAQLMSSIALHRDICERNGIPMDRDHIIGHCEVDPVGKPNCPGKGFNWEGLMAALQPEKKEAYQFPVSAEWVRVNGISDGLRPKDQLAREELWEILYRLSSKGWLVKHQP